MSRRALGALIVVVGVAATFMVAVTAPDAAAFPRAVARTTLVSRNALGVQADRAAHLGAISDDGEFVAFGSEAANLVPSDTNGYADVFRKNVMTGAIDRVNVASSGAEANMVSDVCDMSSNGRYVVFSSKATNLIGNDTNGRTRDIYVRDTVTGVTELVSRSTAGDQANNTSLHASISDDGRYVAFDSMADNLEDRHGISGLYHVYLRDRSQGTTVRVDTSPITLKAANGHGQEPVISDDGRYVAFGSDATNLLATDTNSQADVYRWERIAGTTERVSVTGVATEGDGSSFSPAISADGQTVAFVSRASNFGGAPEPTFGSYQNVYVRHLATQTTELVNVSGTGVPALGLSDHPSISDDGQSVSFSSDAINLAPYDANGAIDVFVRQRLGGRTLRVSLTDTRTESNGSSGLSAITGDGVQVAFGSSATNLINNLSGVVGGVYVTPIGPLEVHPNPSTTEPTRTLGPRPSWSPSG